jgi:hypothetical protein
MTVLKLGRILTGIDFDEYWYRMGAGEQNRGVPGKVAKIDKVKLHKKEKKVKLHKKEKKVKHGNCMGNIDR